MKIPERNYSEIQRAFVAQSWKSVIIIWCGAIEAILLDLLKQDEEKVKSSQKALELSLQSLFILVNYLYSFFIPSDNLSNPNFLSILFIIKLISLSIFSLECNIGDINQYLYPQFFLQETVS